MTKHIGESRFKGMSAPLCLMAVMTVQPALAGGFLLQEQSQREIGRAFSGAAAAADDPSTIFYNPAGMTELEGVQVTTGATLLFIHSAQENRGSELTPSGGAAMPVSGGNGGNPFAPVIPVPTSYASAQLGDTGLWAGVGISAPFGLKLRYDDDWFGRYDSLYSNLLTIDVQPSLAWKISDRLSLGGGIDVQYARVTLTSAVLNPGAADGGLRVSGDDVSLGWNAGLLVKLDGGARLGLHYRSRVKHDIKGDYDLNDLAAPFSAANGVTDVRSPLIMPDIATASISVPVGEATQLMLSGRYYNWSLFQDVRFLREGRAPAVRELRYRDSWSLSAGADHRVSDRLTLRAGTMFDKTPTNADYLTTRIPDGDRIWASAGLSYNLSDRFTLNASYAHVFVDRASMTWSDTVYAGTAAETTITTRSGMSANVDMIATSVTARF